MNYYVEMIKDFVNAEVKKPKGALLEDGEFTFACGMAFTKLTKRDQKKTVEKKRQLVQEITTLSLLKIEILALLKESSIVDEYNLEEENLFRMIKEYKPKGKELDAVLTEALNEGMNIPAASSKYARQERYSKKVGVVSKTYKLNEQVVNDFASACKERGVSLGPTLANLMQQYIHDGR